MILVDENKAWYTVRELANLLHRTPKTIRRLVRPHRSECHLDRNGPHPRRLLWIPASVAQKVAERLHLE